MKDETKGIVLGIGFVLLFAALIIGGWWLKLKLIKWGLSLV